MCSGIDDLNVTIPAGSATLVGNLAIPEPMRGLVLFAHGSGSSRLSPRNRFVAEVLQQREIGTLLFDLLTESEGLNRANVFAIGLLAERLLETTRWIRRQFPHIPLGYFGASTGAAAALMAAAAVEHPIAAVVSRGGRPDLASPALRQVTAPTLLIVGGLDHPILEWNENARAALGGVSELAVIPDATHLFEEPGALEQVAGLAADWFRKYLASSESRVQAAPRA